MSAQMMPANGVSHVGYELRLFVKSEYDVSKAFPALPARNDQEMSTYALEQRDEKKIHSGEMLLNAF
jgi:hypothetical protein